MANPGGAWYAARFVSESASVKSSWKAYRHRLERWGCLWLARWIPRLPQRSCTALAQVAGAVFFWFDRRNRHIALENLRVVYGDRFCTTQRKRIAFLSFQNFARTMLGLFWSAGVDAAAMHRILRADGFDRAAEQAAAHKRALIFACAHFGNWEFAPMAAQMHGLQVHIVAENFKNATLDGIFAGLRSRNFHTLLGQERAFLKLLRCALRGQHCALLADLTVPPSQAAVRVRAFPREGIPLEICCTRLSAVVALRANALVVPALAYPAADGRFEIRALEPLDPARFASEEDLTQAVWEIVEKAVGEFPHLWLWSYKHFRYRPADARREYPDYSVADPRFEEVAKA